MVSFETTLFCAEKRLVIRKQHFIDLKDIIDSIYDKKLNDLIVSSCGTEFLSDGSEFANFIIAVPM